MDVVQQATPETSAAAGPAEPPAEGSSPDPSVHGPARRHTSESQVGVRTCRSPAGLLAGVRTTPAAKASYCRRNKQYLCRTQE